MEHKSMKLESQHTYSAQDYRKTLKEKLKFLEKEMKGTVEYGLTNDYMFRAVMQENPVALSEIVKILLKLPKEDKIICKVTNPIKLGKTIGGKECILDVFVLVNDKVQVNLEMQMSISLDWVKRSLYYACDMYVGLEKGENYGDCKPTYHFGFVKKSPFEDDTQFFSNYVLTETSSGRIYTGDFQIGMINLNQLENATEEDRESGLYDWVALFMAKEWKELMELSKRSDALGNAVVTLAELSNDEKIRQQCEARRKYEMDQDALNKHFYKLKKEIQEKEGQLQEKEGQLQEKEDQLQEKEDQLQEKEGQLQEKEGQLQEKNKQLHLIRLLSQEGRYQEIEKVLSDLEYQKKLLREYQI